MALFATLTAMATLPRSAIKTLLTENASFRAIADDADRFVTDVLEAFITAQYKTVIALLDRHQVIAPTSLLQLADNGGYQPLVKLNPHLAQHAEALYSQIRMRAIIQYFSPFKAVQIAQMADAFGAKPDAMLKEVVGLVQDGKLNARVDLIDRVSLPVERMAVDHPGP